MEEKHSEVHRGLRSKQRPPQCLGSCLPHLARLRGLIPLGVQGQLRRPPCLLTQLLQRGMQDMQWLTLPGLCRRVRPPARLF